MADPGHGDQLYETVGARSASGCRDRPVVSLELLDPLDVRPDQSVIDFGGGASNLVDHLLAAGYGDIAVLDVARSPVGATGAVSWIVQDLLLGDPDRAWDVWHDRAVLPGVHQTPSGAQRRFNWIAGRRRP